MSPEAGVGWGRHNVSLTSVGLSYSRKMSAFEVFSKMIMIMTIDTKLDLCSLDTS